MYRKLAPTITCHGVLLDVYGVGVMLTGDSGLGKSETSLELVKRGHRLVADDAVEITRVADDRISGSAPELTRYLTEIRGIGIIDVRHMFGVGAVIHEKSIDLVIEMELWQEGKIYDRLGLEEQKISILDVDIPRILMPVRPGRNMAIVVEVAARNFRLKSMGYDAAKEFNKRWSDFLA
jgi:HPr kinase/phosphorylase